MGWKWQKWLKSDCSDNDNYTDAVPGPKADLHLPLLPWCTFLDHSWRAPGKCLINSEHSVLLVLFRDYIKWHFLTPFAPPFYQYWRGWQLWQPLEVLLWPENIVILMSCVETVRVYSHVFFEKRICTYSKWIWNNLPYCQSSLFNTNVVLFHWQRHLLNKYKMMGSTSSKRSWNFWQ